MSIELHSPVPLPKEEDGGWVVDSQTWTLHNSKLDWQTVREPLGHLQDTRVVLINCSYVPEVLRYLFIMSNNIEIQDATSSAEFWEQVFQSHVWFSSQKVILSCLMDDGGLIKMLERLRIIRELFLKSCPFLTGRVFRAKPTASRFPSKITVERCPNITPVALLTLQSTRRDIRVCSIRQEGLLEEIPLSQEKRPVYQPLKRICEQVQNFPEWLRSSGAPEEVIIGSFCQQMYWLQNYTDGAEIRTVLASKLFEKTGESSWMNQKETEILSYVQRNPSYIVGELTFPPGVNPFASTLLDEVELTEVQRLSTGETKVCCRGQKSYPFTSV
ncbi:MAG: hypothetical protein ACD_17C00284G0001 [uncultured bacterium]|nr:MAG: hypothetical protein ACD_17C00284G0001 [uncultured bacterium]OGN55630.1 MAG: hypothetical protein A2796_00440 [Chlamydiae bacterium RIFCSPHIGHO2_01_FULL_44_39]OGN59249.1 MAG: hypothetical protein A3C42_03985 [Chlamydiae bacterium RIFCSPHIGHO2_02_FULL_45_9]OGN60422.1 MAG: hypothetical protein A3D96_00865 [Chlamydiae bacterium RIFCSPHIGHO2_12_FULL_44_59]OGN66543.1 MAG: hypothetical protein A2978_05050 [Chlamydiae bacterium RIFCSPLOWO2_01_FULL_44_52]OGN69793.1 MAG: hypothetical protein A3